MRLARGVSASAPGQSRQLSDPRSAPGEDLAAGFGQCGQRPAPASPCAERQQPSWWNAASCHALTTAPIAQQACTRPVHAIPGQTPTAGGTVDSADPSMLFTPAPPTEPGDFNTLVGHTHIPSAVAQQLGPALVERKLECCWPSARRFVPKPRLVVRAQSPCRRKADCSGCCRERGLADSVLERWRRSHPSGTHRPPATDTVAGLLRRPGRGPLSDGYLAPSP